MYVSDVARPAPIPNEVRSAETRARLVAAAVDSLIDLGFVRSSGVEVCRRAGLTRGALHHHFPRCSILFAAALGSVYDTLAAPVDIPDGAGPLEGWVHRAHARLLAPESKVIFEVWLGSQNDPELEAELVPVMAKGSALFDPLHAINELGVGGTDRVIDDEAVAVYRTVREALIGLGIGRATNGNQPLGHTDSVVSVLLQLARATDERLLAAA